MAARPDPDVSAGVVTDKAAGQESLAPQEARIMGRVSYFLAWLGGCVSIGTFTMGSSLVGTLNLTQSVLAMAIGCFVIGGGLAVNGAAGYRYGIPFMVQARSSFGFTGSRNVADTAFSLKPKYAPWIDIWLSVEGPVEAAEDLPVADEHPAD